MKEDVSFLAGEPRDALSRIRAALAELHKALLDSEKTQYEGVFGPITSTPQFLSLVLNDAWFSWLRPLSSLVAELDEALDEKENPVTAALVARYIKTTRKLLRPNDSSPSGFNSQYLEALQRDPDVIWSHARLTRMMGARERAEE